MEYLDRLFFHKKSGATNYIEHWEMENHEKFCFLKIMEMSQPETAIEIGSRQLGSLQFLSKHFQKTFCLDIDSSVLKRINTSNLPNVRFVQGDSAVTLPNLLKELEIEDRLPSFIHIDGNHSTQGAKTDIENVINLKPSSRTYVLIHDSFNPEVREAIKTIDYNQYKHIHFIDIDFCPGILHSRKDIYDQIWGGFTLLVLDSVERSSVLTVHNNFEYTFEALKQKSSLYKNEPI